MCPSNGLNNAVIVVGGWEGEVVVVGLGKVEVTEGS
jgi:hypothetical protein